MKESWGMECGAYNGTGHDCCALELTASMMSCTMSAQAIICQHAILEWEGFTNPYPTEGFTQLMVGSKGQHFL